MFNKIKVERVGDRLKASPLLSWIFTHVGVSVVIISIFLLLFQIVAVKSGAMLMLLGMAIAVIEEKAKHG